MFDEYGMMASSEVVRSSILAVKIPVQVIFMPVIEPTNPELTDHSWTIVGWLWLETYGGLIPSSSLGKTLKPSAL